MMALQPASDLVANDPSTSDEVCPPVLSWAYKYRGVSTSNNEKTFN